MELGPSPHRMGCQVIGSGESEEVRCDFPGSVGKTTSWSRLLLLEHTVIAGRKQYCSGGDDRNGNGVCLFFLSILPLTSPIGRA